MEQKEKKEFIKSLGIIQSLFEFEIKNILFCYERNKIIYEKENILNEYIFKKGTHKEINGYIFINGVPIESVIKNGKIYLLHDDFYFVKRINYGNLVGLLAIFEKYIPKLVSEIIFYDRNIIKNKEYKLKLSSYDIYYLTGKDLDMSTDDMLIRMLSFEIIQNILQEKKEIFKKIGKLLNIKFAKNEDVFKNFIEIRNIICHLDGISDFGAGINITNRKINGYTLYLKSEDVIKIVNYILDIVKELNKKIIEKYKQ